MRRPAQQLGPLARTAWAHPYTGVLASAVFYNDGGQGGAPATAPAAPAVPSPADLAARTAPAPAQVPAQPAAPANPADAVLLDHGTGAPMTQGAFTKIMARENSKGRRAAFRELCESAGIPFDPDSFDAAKFGELLKSAEATRQQNLSDEQRRKEDLDRREQELQARLDAASQREAEATQRDRDTRIRQALVTLGATGADLDDAAALLRVPDDADDAAITKAAEELKARRGEMFGGQAAPQPLPPAPSGAPAGGNAPRQPASTKDAVNEAARKRAEAMGLRSSDAA